MDEEETFLADLANSGIEGVYKNQWRFKVLRSKDGWVPASGDSGRRRAFMSQQLSLFPILKRPNVVLLWEFLDDRFTQFDLKLALPKGVYQDGTVDLHYITQVPWLLPMEEFNSAFDSPVDITVQRKSTSETYDEEVPSQYDLRGEN